MLGLVTTEDTSGLDLGGGSLGQLLVEVDDALHRDGVGVGTDRLCRQSASASESRYRHIKFWCDTSSSVAHTSPRIRIENKPVISCRASSVCVEAAVDPPGFRLLVSQSLQISQEFEGNRVFRTYLGRSNLRSAELACSFATGNQGGSVYLGRDERRERSACDEAHCDCGCRIDL